MTGKKLQLAYQIALLKTNVNNLQGHYSAAIHKSILYHYHKSAYNGQVSCCISHEACVCMQVFIQLGLFKLILTDFCTLLLTKLLGFSYYCTVIIIDLRSCCSDDGDVR